MKFRHRRGDRAAVRTPVSWRSSGSFDLAHLSLCRAPRALHAVSFHSPPSPWPPRFKAHTPRQRPRIPAEITLREVRVSSEQEKETATGPVIGYHAKRASTATKTDTLLSETPQAVTVVTSQQMTDQGAANLQDALGYAAGVRSDAYGLDSRTDSVRVRGSNPGQLPGRPARSLRLLHQPHPRRPVHAGAPGGAARPFGHAVRRGHGRRRDQHGQQAAAGRDPA
jgi:hypothetical protein